jgi:hypothetical protein
MLEFFGRFLGGFGFGWVRQVGGFFGGTGASAGFVGFLVPGAAFYVDVFVYGGRHVVNGAWGKGSERL